MFHNGRTRFILFGNFTNFCLFWLICFGMLSEKQIYVLFHHLIIDIHVIFFKFSLFFRRLQILFRFDVNEVVFFRFYSKYSVVYKTSIVFLKNLNKFTKKSLRKVARIHLRIVRTPRISPTSSTNLYFGMENSG